ncbi:MAG: hypothetical protein GXO79_10925 [Chlorobi bacterium]|nr:hypothetical protein [Chlorobiota bacterium]
MTNTTWNNKKELRNEWWSKMRLKYNIGLIISGISAFVLYVIVVEFVVMKNSNDQEVEITLFTTIFQGIGYLIMIGIANLFYNLGAISEKLVNPKNIEEYRNKIFKIGFWFSCGLPFLVPLILLITYL